MGYEIVLVARWGLFVPLFCFEEMNETARFAHLQFHELALALALALPSPALRNQARPASS
jgi:hypothetical protein